MLRRRFQGSFLQLVDDKNRVSVPSRFRDILAANTAPDQATEFGFAIVGYHPVFPCLIGYDSGWADEDYARAPEGGADPHFSRMQELGEGDELRFDSGGRISLPGYLRREAKIGKHAFFRGAYQHFEIWDPETLLAHPDVSDRAKMACRGVMEDKGLM